MDSATLYRVGNFDQATVNQLAADTGSLVEAISAAGALSLNTYVSELTVSGTKAYTLAAPTFAGQRKRIQCVSAASTPLGTVTITSPDDTAGFVCPAAPIFTAVAQCLELIATSALKWRIQRAIRAGVQILVVGTTVTTGMVLADNYSLSVTGTVSSTTTKALPDGIMPGEIIVVSQSTAASTPIGNINFTGLTLANVAATDLQAFGVTTDTVTLKWNGAAWLVIANSGVTVA